jgi:hypothetical protein
VVGHWFSRSLSCFTQTRFVIKKAGLSHAFGPVTSISSS